MTERRASPQVVRHQQLYGADDSYNDDYTWRRVNASLFKAVGGELLLMSRKQTLPPRAADASAETSQQIDFFNTRQVIDVRITPNEKELQSDDLLRFNVSSSQLAIENHDCFLQQTFS